MKIILNIIIKEFLQLKRDPRLLAIVFMAPVLQLILLGYAANMDVNTVHTTIFDMDNTTASRNLIQRFERSGYFEIDDYADNYKQVTEDINSGKALWALVNPKGVPKKNKAKSICSLAGIV
jgi:ABC-2 type transport system permease protein